MSQRELAFYLNPVGPHRRSIMQHLAEAGVRYIGTDGFPWLPGRDEQEFDTFLSACAEFGLEVCSTHSVLPLLTDARSALPPEFREVHQRELERLARVGSKTAVYHACFMRDVEPEHVDRAIAEVGWDAFAARYTDALRIVAAAAAAHGITIVLENTWHSVHAQSVTGYIDLIRQAGSDNVGVLLDSGHANLCGRSVAEELRAAGDLLLDLHFHDNHGTVNGLFLDQHLPPGLGTIDWQEVCRALDDMSFAGPVVFEGVLGPGDSIEKGRFGGKLTHQELIRITIANWRACECLAEQAVA